MTDVEFKLALNERLCDLAELMLHQYNPCNQQDGGCVAGKPNPCCTNTRFGKTGCPFFDGKCKVRLIWCKYWLCEIAIRNTKPECVEVLKHIQEIGKMYELIGRPFLGCNYVGRAGDVAKLDGKQIS